MKKLKNLLTEVFEDVQSVDKHSVIEGVRNYGIVGKSLYNGSNIMEVAEQLAQVAESAHHHILGENDDWFDQISVNKNMKALKGNVMEFQKTAKEAHALNQRLTGLYEDIGHVLNRYYEIDEVMDETLDERLGDPDNRDMVSRPDGAKRDGRDHEAKNENLDGDKTGAKDGHNSADNYAKEDGEAMNETSPGHRTDAGNGPDSGKGGDANGEEIREEKGDMDGDGKDEPDSKEYMDNKDKAIKKAMKEEGTIRLKDIVNGIVGLKSVGTSIKRN